jgi:hypothetical protein
MQSNAPFNDDRSPAQGEGFKVHPFGHVHVEIVPEEDSDRRTVNFRPGTHEMLFYLRRGKVEQDYNRLVEVFVAQTDLLTGLGYTEPPAPRPKRKYTRKAKPQDSLFVEAGTREAEFLHGYEQLDEEDKAMVKAALKVVKESRATGDIPAERLRSILPADVYAALIAQLGGKINAE